jgi:hypothetical protein
MFPPRVSVIGFKEDHGPNTPYIPTKSFFCIGLTVLCCLHRRVLRSSRTRLFTDEIIQFVNFGYASLSKFSTVIRTSVLVSVHFFCAFLLLYFESTSVSSITDTDHTAPKNGYCSSLSSMTIHYPPPKNFSKAGAERCQKPCTHISINVKEVHGVIMGNLLTR